MHSDAPMVAHIAMLRVAQLAAHHRARHPIFVWRGAAVSVLPQPSQQSVVQFSRVLGVEVVAQFRQVLGQRSRRREGRQLAGPRDVLGYVVCEHEAYCAVCLRLGPDELEERRCDCDVLNCPLVVLTKPRLGCHRVRLHDQIRDLARER
jgi:hypothetical protein